nr:hypothetical protein CFP56_78488 [Quercus suber]
MLMGFPNPSTGMKFEFPGPNATLIAEGAWDEKDNQFCGVACRILADASVGDCSIGFSLRFPASWERPSDPQGLRYEYTEIEEDELKSNHSRMLNMSYKTGFTPPPDFRDTGLLCMIGCWHLDFQLNDQNSIKNGSLNCETRIKVQFPPLHAEQAEIAKGAIESRRSTSDPLYSESFQLSSNSITTTQAKEPIWKLKL